MSNRMKYDVETSAGKLVKGDYVTELYDEVWEVIFVNDFEITIKTRYAQAIMQLPVAMTVHVMRRP